MNLLIENLNSTLLHSIDINIIKTLNGEFSKEDLERELVNLYFNKVINDITAIKNYADYNSLFEFLSFFDKNKIIILLNDSDLVNSTNYLSKLVKEGYYNFTRNVQGINYLIEHPNEYKDVEKYDVSNTFQSPLFEGNNNICNNVNVVNNDVNNNISMNSFNNNDNNKQIVIGIQNLTDHAGATTLMYMLIKHLRDYYKVVGIELLSQDYIYFRDSDIIGCTSIEDLKMKLSTYRNKDIIILDLNGVDAEDLCNEILYLIDPGIIKLNKLINSKKDVSKGKVILNRSSIKDEDISNFEYETKIKVFYNLSNISDRADRLQKIDNLIAKLNLKGPSSHGGIFGIFK